MSEDELLDLVNEKDEVIGTVWKSEAHKNPSRIHREVAVQLFDKKRRVLIQQRSYQKEFHPGKWMVAVAGHVRFHEKPKDAANRETKEELGLKLDLKYYGKEFDRNKKESRFFWIYYAILEGSEKIKIDKDETEEYRWINFEEINNYDLTWRSKNSILKMKDQLRI